MQKKLVDKLVEVSPENISEIKMAEITLAEHENGMKMCVNLLAQCTLCYFQ